MHVRRNLSHFSLRLHAVMDVYEAECESHCSGETGCSLQADALVQPSSAAAERTVSTKLLLFEAEPVATGLYVYINIIDCFFHFFRESM